MSKLEKSKDPREDQNVGGRDDHFTDEKDVKYTGNKRPVNAAQDPGPTFGTDKVKVNYNIESVVK